MATHERPRGLPGGGKPEDDPNFIKLDPVRGPGYFYDDETHDAYELDQANFAVGDYATLYHYSDADVYEVIAKSNGGRKLTLRQVKATLLNGFKSGEPDALTFSPGGFFGHTSGTQRYAYFHDPNGEVIHAYYHTRGKRYYHGSSRLGHGLHQNYDYNF